MSCNCKTMLQKMSISIQKTRVRVDRPWKQNHIVFMLSCLPLSGNPGAPLSGQVEPPHFTSWDLLLQQYRIIHRSPSYGIDLTRTARRYLQPHSTATRSEQPPVWSLAVGLRFAVPFSRKHTLATSLSFSFTIANNSPRT